MDANTLKIEAARAALGYVTDGARLGIGTGSTAEAFVTLLAERVAGGLAVTGVATSERTQALCEERRIPMSTLDETPHLDLTIDGADEIGPDLTLIKGGGGALLREKIVAAASDRMVVIVDSSKLVGCLGAFPLPVEVNRFGLAATVAAIGESAAELGLAGPIELRTRGGQPFVTDGGHLIVDASFGRIPEPRALSDALHRIPGVVEHGIFLDLAKAAVVAGPRGVEIVGPGP